MPVQLVIPLIPSPAYVPAFPLQILAGLTTLVVITQTRPISLLSHDPVMSYMVHVASGAKRASTAIVRIMFDNLRIDERV
ncbi:hypothetical protein HZ326_25225 [Fusarium oxysporum f. sp. albedinis]|nr:hypothetical protein HZ326_25225 [Fusarium oxysporum f. sp. albedinis]